MFRTPRPVTNSLGEGEIAGLIKYLCKTIRPMNSSDTFTNTNGDVNENNQQIFNMYRLLTTFKATEIF